LEKPIYHELAFLGIFLCLPSTLFADMQWCFEKLLYKFMEEIMIVEWKSLDAHRELPTN
jgi:hypothetical protein